MLLNYDDEGPGPVVVLLHGFPMDRTIWSSQTATLGSVYRVIAPDLRGFGRTAAPEGIYAIDGMADDVIETLDALGITQPVAFGGVSMGGYVALSIAVRYPERVRALMLVDTRAGADSPEASRNRMEQALQVEQAGDAGPVVAAMMPRLFAEATRRDRAEVIARVEEQMSGATARAVVGALLGMAGRPDRTDDLARIAAPTLVLVGEHDRITTPDEARKLADGIPGARLVVIPHAGHLAPVENPEAVNRAMLDFLGALG